MKKTLILCSLFCVALCVEGLAQPSTQAPAPSYTYHPASEDKQSWQRLNLQLSSTFILVVKEGQADLDVCLLEASRSLGLSRSLILAEGIDDPELLEQSQWLDEHKPVKGIQLLSRTKGSQHLELLILLGAYYAFQPRSYFLHRDSVEYFLTKAINESKSLKEDRLGRQALCLLGKMYVQGKDIKKGDSVFTRLIQECKAAGDVETEARAYFYRGFYKPFSPATGRNMISDLKQAAEIYHQSNNIEGEINALTDVGYLQAFIMQTQTAYEVLLKALQLEEEIQFPYTHYNTDILAYVTMAQRKFGEPLKYTIQTIRTAENSRDSLGWGDFYSRLSQLYFLEGGRDKEASKWSDKAIDRFLADRNPRLYYHLISKSIKMIAEKNNQGALDMVNDILKQIPPTGLTDQFNYHFTLFNIYNSNRQFGKSLKQIEIVDSLETILESIRGEYKRAGIHSLYAHLHFKQGNFREARSYLHRYFLSPLASRGLTLDLDNYRDLIYLDSVLHDPQSGLAHYRKYTELLDSSFKVSKVRQAEELQVIYQTQEKENQITALNKQAALEQANLKQATLVKNLTVGGIITVAIIAGLLYRQSRLRKKNNTVITSKNEQLQHFLKEKEWLIKEIHHRVKNNLQIVMSLLNSQSAYIENGPALTAIHDSQHRVHAMSLIHQKLYNSENVSSIDMSIYIRELVSYLADSFNTGQRIRFELDVEPLVLDVSQACPLGLILNEVITNSIKYAFPDGRSGVITIALSTITPHEYLLSISDDGIGMPPQVKNKKPGSLGMSLIAGLTEDLDGKISIESNKGTTIKISFVHDSGVKRLATLTTSSVSNN